MKYIYKDITYLSLEEVKGVVRKEIGGEFSPRSIGIITKVDRKWNKHSFFSDISLPTFKTLVEASIWKIYAYSESGKTIVFPSDGIGTGKAMLKEKAPLCWEYLCKRLKEEFDYDNGQSEN